MGTPLGPITAFPNVNTFTLCNTVMPGKWTLLDARKKFGWQIQQGYGLSGAYVFPKGDELVVPKFRGEFWDSGDMLVFRLIRTALLIKPSATLGIVSAALGINHPELKVLGVTSVVVLETGPLLQGEGGLWTINIDFLQFRPPLPAPAKPKLVIPDVGAPLPTAQGAQQIQIQKLQAEAAAALVK